MPNFFESILSTISNYFSKTPQEAPPPPPEALEDTEIETRRQEDPNFNPDDGDSYTGSAYNWYETEVKIATFRKQIYEEYDRIEAESPLLDTALDIYADNACQGDVEDHKVVKITTNYPKVENILNQAIRDLKLDSESWSIVRNIAKYGESFEETVYNKKLQITKVKNLDGRYMYRNENKFGELKEKAFTQKNIYEKELANFYKWQIIHFRNRKARGSKYGTGLFFSLRRPYKQLAFMKDGVCINRLTRANQRYAHMVEVGQMTPEDAEIYINKQKRKLRKRRIINPTTGQMNINYNPLSIEEDIFIATNKDSRADVKVLGGSSSGGNLADLEHFQNEVIAGTKIPKAYLGLERDMNAKSTLTEQDVQFARTIRRLQYALQEGYRELFNRILLLNNIPVSEIEYSIGLPIISTIDEIRKWEIDQIKASIATELKISVGIPDRYIYKHLLDLTDEEIAEIEIDKEEELRFKTGLNRELGLMPDQQDEFQKAKDFIRANKETLKKQNRKELRDIQMMNDWIMGKEVKPEDVY